MKAKKISIIFAILIISIRLNSQNGFPYQYRNLVDKFNDPIKYCILSSNLKNCQLSLQYCYSNDNKPYCDTLSERYYFNEEGLVYSQVGVDQDSTHYDYTGSGQHVQQISEYYKTYYVVTSYSYRKKLIYKTTNTFDNQSNLISTKIDSIHIIERQRNNKYKGVFIADSLGATNITYFKSKEPTLVKIISFPKMISNVSYKQSYINDSTDLILRLSNGYPETATYLHEINSNVLRTCYISYIFEPSIKYEFYYENNMLVKIHMFMSLDNYPELILGKYEYRLIYTVNFRYRYF